MSDTLPTGSGNDSANGSDEVVVSFVDDFVPEKPRTRRAKANSAVCGARKRDGSACQRPPGFDTDHLGVGRCSRHGGNRQRAINQAAVALGEHYVTHPGPLMGTPLHLEPADALAHCIAIAAGEVQYCTMKVMELEDALVRPAVDRLEETDGEYRSTKRARIKAPPELHLWIKERQKAVDRLARLSKMAIDAGLAERQIALAENQAHAFATAMKEMTDMLGLTARQQKVMRERLPAILYGLEVPGATFNVPKASRQVAAAVIGSDEDE